MCIVGQKRENVKDGKKMEKNVSEHSGQTPAAAGKTAVK